MAKYQGAHYGKFKGVEKILTYLQEHGYVLQKDIERAKALEDHDLLIETQAKLALVDAMIIWIETNVDEPSNNGRKRRR